MPLKGFGLWAETYGGNPEVPTKKEKIWLFVEFVWGIDVAKVRHTMWYEYHLLGVHWGIGYQEANPNMLNVFVTADVSREFKICYQVKCLLAYSCYNTEIL